MEKSIDNRPFSVVRRRVLRRIFALALALALASGLWTADLGESHAADGETAKFNVYARIYDWGGSPNYVDGIYIPGWYAKGKWIAISSTTHKASAEDWPADPVWPGHRFLRWVNVAGSVITKDFVFGTGSASSQYEIYPVFEDAAPVTKWQVKFDPNGGAWQQGHPGAPQYIEIEDNQPLGTLPQNLDQTGKTLIGWSEQNTGGVLVNENTKVTNDMTLYAQWADNRCLVTFNANGGAWADGTTNDKILINPKDASLGGNKPDAPSREGFTFEGWKDESGNIVEDSQIGNIIIASDREFTAHWISTLPVTDKEPPKTTTPPPTTSQQAVKAQVKSFGVTQKTIYVKRGKKVKLPLIAYTTAPGKQVVKWKASKPKVASVKKGKKTGTVKLNGNKNSKLTIKAGKKLGTSKITLTAASGKKLVIKVKVVKQLKKVCAASVKIKKLSAKKAKRLKVGQVKRLVAKFTKKATAIATWKSSKPKVVKIDAAGRITVLKKGTAKITLKVGGKKKTLKIRVR